MPKFNNERVAAILAESYFAPSDQIICDRWQINRRTLLRYRQRQLEDAELSHLVALKKRLLEQCWRDDARAFLKRSITKLEQLVEQTDNPEQIHQVAGSIKIIGELTIAQGALEDNDPADYYFASKIEERN